jgi:hypothetical protein
MSPAFSLNSTINSPELKIMTYNVWFFPSDRFTDVSLFFSKDRVHWAPKELLQARRRDCIPRSTASQRIRLNVGLKTYPYYTKAIGPAIQYFQSL